MLLFKLLDKFMSKICLDDQAQKAVSNELCSTWRLVTNSGNTIVVLEIFKT